MTSKGIGVGHRALVQAIADDTPSLTVPSDASTGPWLRRVLEITGDVSLADVEPDLVGLRRTASVRARLEQAAAIVSAKHESLSRSPKRRAKLERLRKLITLCADGAETGAELVRRVNERMRSARAHEGLERSACHRRTVEREAKRLGVWPKK